MRDKYVYVLTYHGQEKCAPIAAAAEDKGFEVLNARMALYTPEMQRAMTITRVEVFQ